MSNDVPGYILQSRGAFLPSASSTSGASYRLPRGLTEMTVRIQFVKVFLEPGTSRCIASVESSPHLGK